MMRTRKIHTKHVHTCTRARGTRVYPHAYANTNKHACAFTYRRVHDAYANVPSRIGMLGKGTRDSRKGEGEGRREEERKGESEGNRDGVHECQQRGRRRINRVGRGDRHQVEEEKWRKRRRIECK